jgi:hypothetical protein
MDAPIWTGVNTANAITISTLQFQPDFVWGKTRSVGYTHGLADSVRGVSAGRLQSNATTAEVAPGSFPYGSISAFNSNGFTASPGSSTNENWNQTSATYVAWCWKAGGAAVTNTAGTISSQVSANTTSGFSVVTFTMPSTNLANTVGHGLGVAPAMYIVKSRSVAASWFVYHQSLGATKSLTLNGFNGADTGQQYWNNTAPTSSVFSIGQAGVTYWDLNATMVAYCFSEVAGYSKMGSYTGNGSGDGPFVYCGFKPKFIIWKNAGPSANGWVIEDTSRSPINAVFDTLQPDSAGAEGANPVNSVDFVSNGFKIRGTSANINQSGQPIIFMAFAENPFKYANAR